MGKVRVLVLRAPGTNCDGETAFAFEEAGARAFFVDIGELIRREKRLSDYGIMVIPGGFTYGDDIAAGKVLANELKLRLGGDVPDFLTKGGLILGICNGFQALVKAGILPGVAGDIAPLTLWNNDSGRFECRWVHLVVKKDSPCLFTRGIRSMYLPVAHGEGKVIALPETLTYLNPVLFYADAAGNWTERYPDNPNGSPGGIAGISDATGRIFGLMPHPERHIRKTQHPQWTRQNGCEGYGDGFKIFENAAKWAAHL